MTTTDALASDGGIFSAAVRTPLQFSSLGLGSAQGVDPDDLPVIRALIAEWQSHYARNLVRSSYYFAHEKLKDFGISIPDRIRSRVSACIGWPAKAVRSLADLSAFDGVDTGDSDPYGVQALADDSALDVAVPQAIVSAYMHGCAFLTLTQDDAGLAITPRSAGYSSALWDGRRNRLRAALTIADATSQGQVTAFTCFLPYRSYSFTRAASGWSVERTDTRWPEPTVVPFISDPQLSRPLGRSRITRPLMALTDMGYRTLVRMEATAEFYSVPKLWFLNLPDGALPSDGDSWSSLISTINGITADGSGITPELKQVSQASMQPHSDMLKTIAMCVAAETNLPVDSLGITLDNPTSAEAMAAAERKLTREADRQNRFFGHQIERLLRMAVCLRDGLAEPPAELRSLRALWMPTREISDAARADAYVKVSQVNSAYSTSTVGLRRLGLTGDEITSLQSDITRASAVSVLDRLANAGGEGA